MTLADPVTDFISRAGPRGLTLGALGKDASYGDDHDRHSLEVGCGEPVGLDDARAHVEGGQAAGVDLGPAAGSGGPAARARHRRHVELAGRLAAMARRPGLR